MIDQLFCSPHLSDLLGFAALVLLAAPALAVARLAARTWRFLLVEHGASVDPLLKRDKQHTEQKLARRSAEWQPWHGVCLYTGYGAALASYLVKLYPVIAYCQ